jgi:hypothetical protein
MKITRFWRLSSSAVLAATLCCPVAAQVGTAGAAGQQPWVAQVKVSRGIVRIERAGQRFPCPVGARLKVEDTVITEANGSVGLMFADNSTLSMGPEGEVFLKTFNYDPTTYLGAFDAFVKKGTVSLQAGNLAQGAEDSVKIQTPQAEVKGNARQLMVNVEGKK